MFRAVVVDDEPLARARICKLLREHDDIHVTAECRNGKEAIELIHREQPHLIFLDVQMPDMDGFDVLRNLDLSNLPIIVFTTAYDRYALRAFDTHAIDYLLKPFDRKRFREAVERARAQLDLEKASGPSARVRRLLADFQDERQDRSTCFRIRRDGHPVILSAAEVYWIEADGNYVALHLRDRTYLHRATLSAVAKALERTEWLRIHRCYLVNRKFIKTIKYVLTNQYRFLLTNDAELTSSRSYKTQVIKAISDCPTLVDSAT